MGLELLIPLLFVLGVVLWMMFTERPHWLVSMSLCGLSVGMIGFLYTIYYQIENETLIVHYGIGYKRCYDIKSIKSIERCFNPLSAPAASLSRLELNFYNGDFLLVSSKDKAAFIAAMRQVNSQIILKS